MEFLQINYRARLFKMYIINSPASIYIPWKIVQNFLDEVTLRKIQILKKNDLSLLFEYTNLLQIEKKYGGKCENIDNFW